MRLLKKSGEWVALHLSDGERETLIQALAAAKVTDPVITDASVPEIEHYQELVYRSTRLASGYALGLNEFRFLTLRQMISAVVVMGEREDYSAFINEAQNDARLDRIFDELNDLYIAAFAR